MHVLRLEDFMNGDHTWFERTFRYAVYGSCEPVRRPKGRKKRRGGEEGERKRGWTGGKREGRREKKRWNSVVYPVIYNWKLGTTTRPKAIRRFHSGESSPFSVLAKVVRPSTIVDPPFLRLFLRAVANPNSAFVRDSRVLSFSGCQPIRVRHGPTSPFHTRDKYSWYGVKNRWFGADRRKTVAPQDLVSPSLEMSAKACARLFGFSSSAS